MKAKFAISLCLICAGPVFANIGGFCAAVDAQGDAAYIGAGQILLKLDVSDPATPTLANTLALSESIEAVLAEGTNIYAACGAAGVLRISADLTVQESYNSPGHAYGLAFDGSALYLADGTGGLQQLDPLTLSVTGSFMTNAPAMDVIASGSSIYLLDHFNGVIKLNSSLTETGTYGLVAFGTRMESDGSRLYVVDDLEQITQIDQATMTLSSAPPAIPTFGLLSGMAIDSGTLYVANGFDGLSIFDASSEALLGTFSGVARSRATAIADGRAYVAAGNSGIKIFDLTDPTNPAYLSSVATSNAVDVAISDGLLLVADAFDGLKVFDATTHSLLGTYTPTSPAVVHRVGASGSRVCIAEGYTVRTLDLSNPATPVVVLGYRSPDYVFDLDISGTNVLLATGRYGLNILSADLKPLASTSLSNATFSISADGVDALADWTLLDLTDPLTPVASTNFTAVVHALQTTLAGQTLLASADAGGTAILQLPSQQLYAVAGIEPDSEGIVISWLSEAGKSYTIHKSTNLVEGFYELKSEIDATAPLNTHIDLELNDCALYMITIE